MFDLPFRSRFCEKTSSFMTKRTVFYKMQLLSIFFYYLSSMVGTNGNPTGLSCPTPAPQPLMLTPFILSNNIQKAQEFSRVTSSCLKDFVPPSHSGYITVNKRLGNHLFFWYFPSPMDSTAPLVVWLNGGPGMSSMQGLLFQNGPIQFEKTEPYTSYTQRNDSFVGSFSVLYIDNPVGIGYSFSDSGPCGFRSTQDEYGSDLLEFMNQFVELFPQYQNNNEVYIGGQSYAGKYVPSLCYLIHKSKMRGESKINLKGVYIAGPLFDPETHAESIHDFYFSLGMISNKTLLKYKQKARDEFRLYHAGALRNDSMSKIAKTVVPFLLPTGSSAANYVTGEDADTQKMSDLMNSTPFRSALHVGVNREYLPFNDDYYQSMYTDFRNSTKEKLAVLMDNYKVMIYNGDYDVITNTHTLEAGLAVTQWKGWQEYQDSVREPWLHQGRVLGFFSKVGQFCRAIVHGAGHNIGMDKPYSNLVLLQGFVKDGCVSS